MTDISPFCSQLAFKGTGHDYSYKNKKRLASDNSSLAYAIMLPFLKLEHSKKQMTYTMAVLIQWKLR